MFVTAVFLSFHLALVVAGILWNVKTLVMLTMLVPCNFMGSILFIGIADKRRRFENRPIVLSVIEATTEVSQSKMTAFFFF